MIIATHRDLEKMVAEGTFREDLWFRINAFPIIIPPLKQRKGDIPLLVNHFLTKKSIAFGIHPIPTVTLASLEQLQRHSWPGNVRELENTVERALIQHRNGTLAFDQIINEAGNITSPFIQESKTQTRTLDDVNRAHIEGVLHACHEKVSGADGAAASLGINPSTLRNRMRKLGIVFGHKRV